MPDGRLLVFAHEDEAQAFERVPHFITGIGKVSAAVALAKLLADNPVREIIVLGTAGLIDDSLDINTVYRVRRALQHDLAFNPPVAELGFEGAVNMRGASPGKTGQQFPRQDGESLDDSKDDKTAVIATGDTFVTDDMVRQRLAEQGAGLVDMESYAFAALASGFQVPLRIFKVPSDFADSNTTDETWDDVVARKSQELLEFADSARLL